MKVEIDEKVNGASDGSYREGDEPGEPERPMQGPPLPSGAGGDRRLVTAFLIAVFEDGHTEAQTKLEGMVMRREATLRDVRDFSASIARDVDGMIVANMVAGAQAKLMREAMVRQQEAAQVEAIRRSVGVRGGLVPGRG